MIAVSHRWEMLEIQFEQDGLGAVLVTARNEQIDVSLPGENLG